MNPFNDISICKIRFRCSIRQLQTVYENVQLNIPTYIQQSDEVLSTGKLPPALEGKLVEVKLVMCNRC